MRTSRRRTDFDGKTNGRAESSEHIDKRVGTEEIDAPAEEIADAGLSHAQRLGGRLLFEAASRNELLYLNHEVSPDQQVFGLFAAKS